MDGPWLTIVCNTYFFQKNEYQIILRKLQSFVNITYQKREITSHLILLTKRIILIINTYLAKSIFAVSFKHAIEILALYLISNWNDFLQMVQLRKVILK